MTSATLGSVAKFVAILGPDFATFPALQSLLLHIQQSECAGTAVDGDGRGGLLEVDLVELDVLFDLFADPVGVALAEAYIGYEQDARVYAGRIGEHGADICFPGVFSRAEVGHADAHLALAELQDRAAHEGFDDVCSTGADLACTRKEVEIINDEARVDLLLVYFEFLYDLLGIKALFNHLGGYDGHKTLAA